MTFADEIKKWFEKGKQKELFPVGFLDLNKFAGQSEKKGENHYGDYKPDKYNCNGFIVYIGHLEPDK